MNIVWNFITAISFLGSLWFLAQAILTPAMYSAASAIQQSALYSIGTYNAALAAACLLLAIFARGQVKSPQS